MPLAQKYVLMIPVFLSAGVYAEDFAALDSALPAQVDAASIAPVFDFDDDSCLPAAGISRDGEKNKGLMPTGRRTGDCRSDNFLEQSNTLHRYACKLSDGHNYCGHFYSLYFEKDQIFEFVESGHRHDWEYVAVWTKDGAISHGSYSAHGYLYTDDADDLVFADGHLKIVYHKDGVLTHAMRFARADESAENPYGQFVTPPIISWYEFTGDHWGNRVMRNTLNNYDYLQATIPMRDDRFLSNLNKYKPNSYPDFTEADVLAANHGLADNFYALVNKASGLCMDITNAVMAANTNVMQWGCNGGHWQKWSFDKASGQLQSQQDPRYCLTANPGFDSGSEAVISRCIGAEQQRFIDNGDGSFGFVGSHRQVLDGFGRNQGDTVGIGEYNASASQQWTWQ